MSIFVRFFTLLTIAAAGFALPLSCAQSTSASDFVTIEVPAIQQIDSAVELPDDSTGADTVRALTEHLFDSLPLDCGDSSTAPAAEQPATFDTQPYVPGYLTATIGLDEESPGFVALPSVLIPIESRAGPPDGPPPKSID